MIAGLAIGLMLILEGLLPFAAPEAWRKAFSKLAELSPRHVRLAGLFSMALGLLIFLGATTL